MSTASANSSGHEPATRTGAAAPFTLGVDIGGTNIKASVLDAAGVLAAEQIRSPTPKPATPQAVLETVAKLAAQLPPFQRISVGFPGVVNGGKVVTAPNLGTSYWAGFQLIEALADRFGTPVRLLNDAAVQGLGVVEGHGLECVLTLGTGVGCALFRNRRLLLHLELGQYHARRRKTYDQYIGQAALAKKGTGALEPARAQGDRHGDRPDLLRRALYRRRQRPQACHRACRAHVRIVSNTAGITGGIRLWEPELDELFCGEPMAQAQRRREAAMKALTVGGAMIDTIAIIASDRIERMRMTNADNSFLLLEEGRKTEALEISTHVGGGAVNAAVAMARLGLDVGALVKLGKDARAETVLGHLMQEGVSTRWAMRDGRAPTGASVLISSHDRNAAIFTFRGANTLLEESDLRNEAFAADVVYVSSLSNESADAFPAIIERAKAQGALVATNPGVRQLSSRGSAFQETLKQIDILAVNRSEADVLVPGLVDPLRRRRQGACRQAGRAAAAARRARLHRRRATRWAWSTSSPACASSVPATWWSPMAARGRSWAPRRRSCIARCWRRRSPARPAPEMPSTPRLPPVWHMGRPAEEALRAAAINSASVVNHVDTQTGLLSLQEIDRRLGETKETLEVRKWSH